MSALGMRSCNPGNLRPGASKWLGELAPDPRGYCVFDTMTHGVRAAALNLRAYQDKHNLCTVRGFITRWAPSGDHNDTDAYIADVSRRTGFSPDSWLDTKVESTLRALVGAIGWHENGEAIPDADLRAGVAMALS